MTHSDALRFRISIGLSVTVVAAVLLSIATIVILWFVIKSKDEVIFDHSRDLIQAQKLELAAEQDVASRRAFLLTEDPIFLERSKRAREDFARLVREIRLHSSTLEEKRLLDQVEQDAVEYQTVMDEAVSIRTHDGGSPTLSQIFETQVKPKRDEYVQSLGRFIRHKEDLLAHFIKESSRAAGWAVGLVLGLGGGGVILALGFWIVGTRTILRLTELDYERTRLLDLEQEYRSQTESAKRQVSFLYQVTAALSEGPLHVSARIDKVTHMVVPALADGCLAFRWMANGAILCVSKACSQASALDKVGSEAAPRLFKVAQAIDAGQPMIACPEDPGLRESGIESFITVPLRARGQINGALTLLSLASKRKYEPSDVELAQELADRAAISMDNARLYDDAEAAIRAREEFLSIASHELKNPLSCVIAQLGVYQLKTRTLAGKSVSGGDEQLLKMADACERQCRRLAELVDELMDMARMRAGRLEISRREMDLGELAQEIVDRFDAQAKELGSTVRLECPSSVRGCWDRNRIEQVLNNLISNALKYGRGKPVEITIDESTDLVRMTFRDHGIGMSLEDQHRIFEPYERAASARYIKGLGLGLYITRQLVEAHGGTIRVDSRLGEGSTFTVELPLRAPVES